MKARMIILFGTILCWLAMINVAGACGWHIMNLKCPTACVKGDDKMGTAFLNFFFQASQKWLP
ncbi:hypothetical protein N752_03930 [Desulforamulus aquiferis]|nr:hypothetical protein [Desulforamulus aquiferis]RYD06485.1 hypothetical protein N752_03930 [Desulforamulus aquiferis]